MASIENPRPISLFTAPLTPVQAAKLKVLLETDNFQFEPRPYTLYFAKKDKLTLAVYEKGPKIVLQGKGPRNSSSSARARNSRAKASSGTRRSIPGDFQPHSASTKAARATSSARSSSPASTSTGGIARQFMEGGVQDSKRIGSDQRIRALADAHQADAARRLQRRRDHAPPNTTSSSRKSAT